MVQARRCALEPAIWGASLITAPILMAGSSFFWENGEYGVIGGTLIVLANVFWIPAFIGLFRLFSEKMPYYAIFGLLVVIYGCIGGVTFGFRDLYAAVFQISQEAELAAFAAHPLAFNLMLFWPGPLFPLSLLLLGVNLIRCRLAPLWVGLLLGLGAIAFPLSRIPRIELAAHVADLLILAPLAYLGLSMLSRPAAPGVDRLAAAR